MTNDLGLVKVDCDIYGKSTFYFENGKKIEVDSKALSDAEEFDKFINELINKLYKEADDAPRN